MVKISVVSYDKLFASMICSEIESMGSEYKITGDKAEIMIIDLDSAFSNDFDACCIIGFSRNEELLSSDIADKCYTVLHRPFLLEDLKNLIKAVDKSNPLTEYVPLESTYNFSLCGNSAVELGDKRIHLSVNEYAVLNKLYENSGSPVSREELNKVLSSSGGNMCDVYICHLRTKLESDGNKKFIFTVRGKGYMLKI